MKWTTGFLLTVLLGLLAGCGGAGDEPGGGGEPDGGPEKQPGGTELIVETAGAAWVAYREGEGAWQVLGAGERHTVRLENATGRYGVAHVCLDEADEVAATLFYAALAERAEVATPCSGEDDAETAFYTLSGAVSGLAAGEAARVYGASQTDIVSENAYRLVGLTEGEYDLLVTVQADSSSPPSEVLLTEVAVSGDKTLDLALGKAVSTELNTLTVEGVAEGDEVASSLSLTTKRGTSAELGSLFGVAEKTSLSFDYGALPKLADGAFYRSSVERFSVDQSADGGEENLFSSLERTFTDPQDFTLSVPAPLQAEVSLEGGRPLATWQAYEDGADYRATFENLSEEDETRYDVFLDSTWLEGPSYLLPDFSDLPGWDDAWTLSTDLFWDFAAQVEKENEKVVSSRSGTLSDVD